jgi:hypothetical protein
MLGFEEDENPDVQGVNPFNFVKNLPVVALGDNLPIIDKTICDGRDRINLRLHREL